MDFPYGQPLLLDGAPDPACGVITWAGIVLGTEEEHTFSELKTIYDERAAQLKESGIGYYFIRSMPSLTDVRAAVLSCRKMGLPIFASVTVDEEGLTPSDTTALTCLIVLQELGVTAFGLEGELSPAQMQPIFEELAPFAKIPLIAIPSVEEEGETLSPEAYAEGFLPLLQRGVQYVGGKGTTEAHTEALRKMVGSFDFESVVLPRHSRELVLTSVHETFCYDLDMLEFSPTLLTDSDMTDEFMEVEDESYDIISVEINTPDDAYAFAESDHMAELPVSFLSHDELALKTALLLYCGRAMVDSQSTIERETLEKIAKKYGAVVY